MLIIKEKIDKFDFIELKSIYSSKDTVKSKKSSHRMGEDMWIYLTTNQQEKGNPFF